MNVLLIRDPELMLPSLVHQVKKPIPRDTGLSMQSELLKDLRALGQDPPVLDAKELLLDPEGVLRELCQRIQLPFEEAMLRWPPGPKPEDGSWAKDWYHNIHRSTGFMKYREKTEPFPEKLKPAAGSVPASLRFPLRECDQGQEPALKKRGLPAF